MASASNNNNSLKPFDVLQAVSCSRTRSQRPAQQQRLQLSIHSNNDNETGRGDLSILQSICSWQNYCERAEMMYDHDFETNLKRAEILAYALRNQHIEEPGDIMQLVITEVQSYPGIWNKKSHAYKLVHKKIWGKNSG